MFISKLDYPKTVKQFGMNSVTELYCINHVYLYGYFLAISLLENEQENKKGTAYRSIPYNIQLLNKTRNHTMLVVAIVVAVDTAPFQS